MDIDLKVLSPENEVLLSSERKTEDRFSITAKTAGQYVICFGNAMSTVTQKDVQVGVHAGHGALLDDEVAEKVHLKPIQEKVLDLSDKILQLKEAQLFLRRRADQHASTAQSLSRRVLLSSVAEALVLVGINLWQTYYLRQFFEVKRIV